MERNFILRRTPNAYEALNRKEQLHDSFKIIKPTTEIGNLVWTFSFSQWGETEWSGVGLIEYILQTVTTSLLPVKLNLL